MFVVIGDIKALYCTMLKKSLPSIIYVDMFTIEKKIELKHILNNKTGTRLLMMNCNILIWFIQLPRNNMYDVLFSKCSLQIF